MDEDSHACGDCDVCLAVSADMWALGGDGEAYRCCIECASEARRLGLDDIYAAQWRGGARRS